jgi:hypothetical protein
MTQITQITLILFNFWLNMCFKELLDLLALDCQIQGQNAGFDNPAGATP